MAATIRANHVPVAPLRDHYLKLRARGEITSGKVARNLGWTRKPSPASNTSRPLIPDCDRVNRTLGLRTYKKGARGGWGLREYVTYDMAVRLAEAMGADPWEFGL